MSKSVELERSMTFENARAIALLVVLLIVPTVVGFAPLALFIGQPIWLVVVAGLAALVAAFDVAELRSIQGRPVIFLEKVASGLGALFTASTISLILFGIVLLTRLIVTVLNLANVDWDVDAASRYVVYSLGLIFVPATTAGIATNLRHTLFPTSGIGNPPLFPGLTWLKFFRAAGIALIPAVVLVALWLMSAGNWLYIPLQVYLFGIGAPLYMKKPRRPTPAAVEAIRLLLRAMGYITPDRVQARQIELDRLITVFDIIGYKDGKALAFHFEIGSKDAPPVVWTEAAALRSASWAVFVAADRLHIPVHDVSCVMVLVGRRPDETLKNFAEQESIRIVEIEDEILLQNIVARNYTEQKLRELAQSVLGLHDTETSDTRVSANSVWESR